MCTRKDDIKSRVERLVKAVRAVERVRPRCRNEKELRSTQEWAEQQAAERSLVAFADVAENQVEIFG